VNDFLERVMKAIIVCATAAVLPAFVSTLSIECS